MIPYAGESSVSRDRSMFLVNLVSFGAVRQGQLELFSNTFLPCIAGLSAVNRPHSERI